MPEKNIIVDRDLFDWNPFQGEELPVRHERVYPARKKRPCPARFEGEAHGRAKLTNKLVLEMRWYYAEGVPVGELAKAYKIGVSRVSDIVHRKAWTHI